MPGKLQRESGAQHPASGRGFEGGVHGAVTISTPAWDSFRPSSQILATFRETPIFTLIIVVILHLRLLLKSLGQRGRAADLGRYALCLEMRDRGEYSVGRWICGRKKGPRIREPLYCGGTLQD